MDEAVSLALVCAVVSTLFAPSALADEQLPRGGSKDAATAPGEIIVGFHKDAPRSERDRAVTRAEASSMRSFPAIDARVIRVAPHRVRDSIKTLEADDSVRYAEPNFLVSADDHTPPPDDPSFHELWGLHNFGQTVNSVTGTADADIDATEAWSVATASSNVVVSVIDSGVDFTHPDLGGSMETSPLMWTNAGELGVDDGGNQRSSNGIDDDANGYVDDWRGWDFVNDDNNPFDDNGHGTHVAGTIGAVGNNATGITGVNWATSIMALKFLGSGGSGTTADAIAAVLYAAAEGAAITNNSWGGGEFSQGLLDAIAMADESGSLFVAAAGNDGIDTDAEPHYPSSYKAPNVISVAATTSSDLKASFSNYGKNSVDVGAPGANIYSTYPGATYRYLSGTSMAAPHVAGAAALTRSAFPSATDVGLKALLLRSVDPNAALEGRSTTSGRLNVNTAVGCSEAPQAWIESPTDDFSVVVDKPVTIEIIAGNCAGVSGVDAAISVSGTPLVVTPRGDGLYTATFTPETTGPLTIDASAIVDVETDMMSVSGDVVPDYSFEDAAFSWIDATDGGTKTAINKDDMAVSVSLPFTFAFYGRAFSSMKVSSNGYVVFGSSDAVAHGNESIPTVGPPDGAVAPLWDDLNPARGGAVWHHTIGSAPNRRFVVAWVGVPHYPDTGDATFEVVFEEGTNDIYMQYTDAVFGDSRYDYGRSATVGVESFDGTIGTQFSYDLATLQPYQNVTAIRFTNADNSSQILSVTREGDGLGNVSSSPAGIDCGASCSASYPTGTEVTLTATTADGSTFAGWSGACIGTSTTCTVAMDAAKSVTATFDRNADSFLLTVGKDGAGLGTVSSDPAGIDCGLTCTASFAAGTDVTLTAAPATGSTFGGWNGDCAAATTATCTLTLDADHSATATFNESAATHELTITKEGEGAGSVVSSPAGIDCGDTCSATFDAGSDVTLTASPTDGSTFAGWSGGCSGTATTCTVTMDAATSVAATFKIGQFTLGVTKDGTGTGTIVSSPAGIDCGASCSGSFYAGTAVTLTATPAGGSTFTQWTGACSGTTTTCSVTVDASTVVTATFTADDGGGGDTGTGGGGGGGGFISPTVSIADVSVTEGDTDTTDISFTMTLSEPATTTAMVEYATAHGTADATDYHATSGTATFAPGEVTHILTIPVIGDEVIEADETFLVTLGSTSGVIVGTPSATGTIIDDDTEDEATIEPVDPPVAGCDADAGDLCGTDGADTLTIDTSWDADGDGIVEVYLGAGDDDLCVGSPSATEIIVFADDGNDRVSMGDCVTTSLLVGSAPPNTSITVFGGRGNDVLLGGAASDELAGGAGDDVLSGGGGTDVLAGGLGDDELRGGAGNDRLRGGAGNDALFGGAGSDVLRGSIGKDVLHGGPGRDRCRSRRDNDTVRRCESR